MDNIVIAFDLEDTLYNEISFLKSGYQAVADYLSSTFGLTNIYIEMWDSYQSGVKDVFQKIVDEKIQNIDKAVLIDIYRFHKPRIKLNEDVKSVLVRLRNRHHLALITDGRPRTKRNIINALGLSDYFDWANVYISDEVGHLKTAPYSFEKIMETYPDCQYIYVGDNPAKDFLAPNKLGWITVCLLDNGQNIHPQDFSLAAEYLPQHIIKDITELLDILN